MLPTVFTTVSRLWISESGVTHHWSNVVGAGDKIYYRQPVIIFVSLYCNTQFMGRELREKRGEATHAQMVTTSGLVRLLIYRNNLGN